jgi:hypothetical protein
MEEETGKKIAGKKVTIDLPQKYIEVIDNYCESTLLTRRKWFFDAMMDKLRKDNLINE